MVEARETKAVLYSVSIPNLPVSLAVTKEATSKPPFLALKIHARRITVQLEKAIINVLRKRRKR